MAYKHGVFITETATRPVPMTSVSTPTVVFGTAPVHLATELSLKPTLCYGMSDFQKKFGWSGDFETYTLCEAAQVLFSLYNVSPAIFINVLNPTRHVKDTTVTITGLSNAIKIDKPAVLSTIKITSGEDDDLVELTADDFTAAYVDGKLEVRITALTKIVDDTAIVTFKELDTSLVTDADLLAATNRQNPN